VIDLQTCLVVSLDLNKGSTSPFSCEWRVEHHPETHFAIYLISPSDIIFCNMASALSHNNPT